MLVFGHPQIPTSPFVRLQEIAQVAQSLASAIVYFHATDKNAFELSAHCSQNGVKYAVSVASPLEWALMSNFKPSYILVEEEPKTYQNLADDYLSDARILWVIDSHIQIEQALKIRMDGVVFRAFLGL
ncbi:hypothetical protein HHE02_10750 [Helicobacter heilmannii]|uniref:Uncharacterized protein n=1 Tax=Helicobacter heilmannii TaxID=35817 RepID=A0A0K2XRE7_HELHE|nr:hypothetical protein [Helicobacter heilmannii]CCM10701.1 hypothetical protein BN341_17020 [Helicobacter heilmannii ASB1.4]CRF47780.1 hypothetical protein HHE02_10750 [Helicobacter heilmannii]CRF49203.1 hypothetical protein HHE03_08020 [Helicobacter heilmannii]CRF50871.1 hypothetical protein HHE06_07240 [Helicobacter heilmannii]CRI35265.1 hypothetical protein HHE01_02630 [Helicobacter heilmannii]